MTKQFYGVVAEDSKVFDNESWRKRYELVANIINSNTYLNVLDLGGGDGKLESWLEPHVEYSIIDMSKRHPQTTVADFNKNEFPYFKDPFNLITCLGLIEYIDNPRSFLAHIRRYSGMMILTHNSLGKPIKWQKNWYSPLEMQRMLIDTGWEIERIVENGPFEKVYLCRQIYKSPHL